MEDGEGMHWGWYTLQQLPALLGWMDGGCLEERALADDIHEAFQPLLQPVPASQAANPTDAAPSPVQVQQPDRWCMNLLGNVQIGMTQYAVYEWAVVSGTEPWGLIETLEDQGLHWL